MRNLKLTLLIKRIITPELKIMGGYILYKISSSRLNTTKKGELIDSLLVA